MLGGKRQPTRGAESDSQSAATQQDTDRDRERKDRADMRPRSEAVCDQQADERRSRCGRARAADQEPEVDRRVSPRGTSSGCHVVLFGTSNPEHLRTNIASLSRPALPEEDVARVKTIFQHVDSVSGS